MISTVKRGQFEQWSESQIGLKPGLICRYMFNITFRSLDSNVWIVTYKAIWIFRDTEWNLGIIENNCL